MPHSTMVRKVEKRSGVCIWARMTTESQSILPTRRHITTAISIKLADYFCSNVADGHINMNEYITSPTVIVNNTKK